MFATFKYFILGRLRAGRNWQHGTLRWESDANGHDWCQPRMTFSALRSEDGTR